MHHIRSHELGDAGAVGRIIADGWRVAYSGFMPAEILDKRIDRQWRHAEITEFFTDDFDTQTEHLLVAERDGVVDGFVHIVREDKAGLGAVANINLLYVDPEKFGQGIGRQLMAAAADWLAAEGIAGKVVLSAYEKNPFRGFYGRIGGAEVLRLTHDFSGHALDSVYYQWDDAAALGRGARGEA